MATGARAAKGDVLNEFSLYRSVNRPAPPPPHATTSPLPSPRAPMSLASNRLPVLVQLVQPALLPCALTCPLSCSAATHNPSPSPPPEATTALAPPAPSKKAPPSSIDPRHPPPPFKSASPETRRRVAAFQPLLLLLLLLLISMSHRPSLDHCSPSDDGSAPRHGRPSFRSKLLLPPPPANAIKSTYVPLRTAACACQHQQHKGTHAKIPFWRKHQHHTQHLQTRCPLKLPLFCCVGQIFARTRYHEDRSHLLNSHSQTRQDQGRS
jgi:hypothetical protein